MNNIIVIHTLDNVGNAIEDISRGESILCKGSAQKLAALEDIPYGFKVALKDIAAGSSIIKYGEIIGSAMQNIAAGALVHVHNTEGNRGRGDIV
jgi:altronate dehydratase small subunit